jgi:hypothetical protein
MSIASPIWINQTSKTAGLDPFSLDAPTNEYLSFRSRYANSARVPYVATDNANNFEVGIGRLVYGSPDQITRDIIVSSSNAGSAISWLTGTRQVYAFELSGSAYPVPFTIGFTLDQTFWGSDLVFTGSESQTLTLPALGTVPAGWAFTLKNSSAAMLALAPQDTDQIENFGIGSEWIVPPGAGAQVTPDQTSGVWRVLHTFPHGYDRVTVVTASGTVTAKLNQSVIVINKTIPAATAVTLPTNPPVGKTYSILDGAGNAATDNITISGAANINGLSSYVISTNWGSVEMIWNGTIWNVFGCCSGDGYGMGAYGRGPYGG